ncbi:MAG: DUF268 domain-containing protein [Patescibacteria group bacterium]|nr:DUF268 domain-containing protein [Patescibacteria group bacterium]
MPIHWSDRIQCFEDNTKTTTFDRHYIYHTAWAARILAEIRPKKHIDIASTLYFGTILSAFIKTEFYDLRPATIQLTNYQAKKANLNELPFKTNSVESLSCLHVLEHIGLGRYGDKIDPNGDITAIGELLRVVRKGGYLLIAVPIGQSKVVFNAHRIYSHQEVLSYFQKLTLLKFSLIPDHDLGLGIIDSVSGNVLKRQKYACGCYLFRKI